MDSMKRHLESKHRTEVAHRNFAENTSVLGLIFGTLATLAFFAFLVWLVGGLIASALVFLFFVFTMFVRRNYIDDWVELGPHEL